MPNPDVDVQHAEPGELERKLAGLRRYAERVIAQRQALTLEAEFGKRFARHMRNQAKDRDAADHRRLGDDY